MPPIWSKLRKWLGGSRRTPANSPTGGFSYALMIPCLKVHSKDEAIRKLVESLAAAFPDQLADAEAAYAAVMAREESMPTGLDHGIAVPHGYDNGVGQVLWAVALVDNSGNENGAIADYETIDHSKLQIIVLALTNRSLIPTYLQLMAFVCRTLRDETNCQRLLACSTAEQMRRFFQEAE